MTARPLRIGYLVPGHGLMATAGPTRNALSLARALDSIHGVEVEVAFRSLLDAEPPAGLKVIEIEPGAVDRGKAVDDSAMRGLTLADFFRYLMTLRRFVAESAGRYDVILEKSWLLSGWLSRIAERHGMLGVAIENVVPSPRRHAAAGRMKQARVVAGRVWAGHCLRRSSLVIAETDQLKAAIVASWGVRPSRITVVGLGVDKALFRPMPQAAARGALGVDPTKTVLTYVGLLDETHNLGPAIEAVAAADRDDVELRIVGDGPSREAYLARAHGSARVVMCGRVPHDAVPGHIAAADLCLAPYSERAFAGGALGYSTMKIPEYMSMGRAVAAAPSARARELIEDHVSGMLFANEPAQWRRLLVDLPTREHLARMGEAALARPLPSWDETARGYLTAIERAMSERVMGAGAAGEPVLVSGRR